MILYSLLTTQPAGCLPVGGLDIPQGPQRPVGPRRRANRPLDAL
jgi:hypothetical protein